MSSNTLDQSWIVVILCAFMLILVAFIVTPFNHVYQSLIKDTWANNINVLGLCWMIGIIFMSFATKISIGEQPYLLPLIILIYIMEIFWSISMVNMEFEYMTIFAWSILILTLALSIVISKSKYSTLYLACIPTCVFTLGQISLSHGFWYHHHDLS